MKDRIKQFYKVRNEIAKLINDRNDFNGVYSGMFEIREVELYCSLSTINPADQIEITIP